MQTDSNSLFSIERKRVANFSAYAKASLPTAGSAGRIARVSDSVRGLWMDSGSQFFGLNGEVVNVREFNATGDGATDDRSAINTAATAAAAVANGAGMVFPSGTYRISSNITIPSNVIPIMLPGAKFTVDAGDTLTIGSYIDASPTQHIFAGAGSVAFTSVGLGAGVYDYEVFPEWWGAIGDDSTDCAPAIDSAVNSGARCVTFHGGIYKFGSPVEMNLPNVTIRGNTRVYTDLKPAALDISVGGGPNAMFICRVDSTNWQFRDVRFTTHGGVFNGWAITAIELGPSGQQTLFSTTFMNCWVSMGASSPGFFTGCMTSCVIADCIFELMQTAFNMNGSVISLNIWENNQYDNMGGSFIVCADPSNINHVIGLHGTLFRGGAHLISLTGGNYWIIDDVQCEMIANSPGTDGGFLSLTTCTNVIVSNFLCQSLTGDMSGIKVADSTGIKISTGLIEASNTTAAQTGTIYITGAVDLDIENVTLQDDLQHQILIDDASGSIRLRGIKCNRGASKCIACDGVVTADITIANCELINGEWGGATMNTVALVDLATSGTVFLKNNVVGTNHASSNPVALYRFTGSGVVWADGNNELGSEPLLQGGSTQEVRWDSGSYSPTLTNTTNLTGSTSAICIYQRAGRSVTVTGRIAVQPTAAAGANTVLGVSLPLASNIAAAEDVGGVCSAPQQTEPGGVYGDAANNRATMEFNAVATASHFMCFSFTYRIN